MVGLVSRFLEDAPRRGDDDCVGGEDQLWVCRGWVGGGGGLLGEGVGVDVEAFLARGAGDVFVGRVGGFVEVFGFGGGEDLEVAEADL